MATNNAVNEATAASGKILQGQGIGTASAFSTATYPSTAGTSGKVLISDGTNIVSSTPTFPNASATSGKFIRSDGTNWIASTPTLPTTAGTSGKILQSDGTNYVESTPTYPSTSGSAGKILRSDGTNNVYTTATYPTTTTASQILYSSSTSVIGEITTGNNKFLTTNGSGVPALTNTYLVGTWTPVVTFGGATTGITYSTQNGQYTQIGNMILFSVYVQFSSLGSATGVMRLTGFPVATGTQGFTNSICCGIYSGMSLDAGYQQWGLNLSTSDTGGPCYESGTGKAIQQLQNTNFTSTALFSFSGVYTTA